MLTKNVKTPFGVTLSCHQALRVEGNLLDPNAMLVAHVHGWPSEADYIAHAGKGSSFVWYVPVPMSAIQGTDLSLAVEQALAAGSNTESPFAGASVTTSSLDVDGARARRWANIKTQRDLLDNAPIAHGGYQLDADQNSRMDIMGAVMAMQLAGAPMTATREWRCSDNVMRTLTVADLVAVGQAIASRRQGLIETSDALWQQLQAAQTVAAVEAVVWPVS